MLSEKIVRHSLLLDLVSLSGGRIKFDVIFAEMLIQFHYSSHVSAAIAVVRSRKDGSNLVGVSIAVALSK
jgi:hypothetical protein